jgi:lysophospholipase L1-like esterase
MIVDGQSLGNYSINSGSDILPVRRIADVSLELKDDGSPVEFRQPFRENNTNAVKTWSLSSNKAHSFKLKIKSGTLLLNFITNHMYYFQNAGVGGFAASDFLLNGVISTTREIVAFDPDLFMFESSTNDANYMDNAPSTNEWVAQGVEFTRESTTSNKIIINRVANIQAGDIVVMGNYNNNQDINDIEVGIVKSWNSGTKEITFTKNMSGKNLVLFCQIKRITQWENNVKSVINRVKTGVGHNVEIGIGTSGVPNLTERKLMGYREKGQMMAAENGWMFFDFFEKVRAVESGVDDQHKWSVGDNTHPNENGYPIFGSAITDVLKAN